MLLMFVALPVQAQDATYVFDPQYRQMVRQLMTYVPPTYNFGTFRKIYTQSKYYDPMGVQPAEDLLGYAYAVETSDNADKSAAALERYNGVLTQHLADIGVVRQAYALARQNPRFGDTGALLQIYNGLLESIMRSGDGLRLNTAYHVITLAEEVIVLGQIGLRIAETKYHEMSIMKYNMHFVKDPAPDQPLTIFINIGVPLRELESREDIDPTVPNDLRFKG